MLNAGLSNQSKYQGGNTYFSAYPDIFRNEDTTTFDFTLRKKCKDSVQKIFCFGMYISTLHIKTTIQKLV